MLFIWIGRFALLTEEFGGTDPSAAEVFNVVMIFYAAIGVFLVLIGVIAIVGGAYALRRRLWGLALAGAIASAVIFLPFGVVAVIFTSLAKGEFSTPGQTPPVNLQTPEQVQPPPGSPVS